MRTYTIIAKVVTADPDKQDTYVTEEWEFTAEAPSFWAACRLIRERYSSPYATVFIDRDQAKRDREAVA